MAKTATMFCCAVRTLTVTRPMFRRRGRGRRDLRRQLRAGKKRRSLQNPAAYAEALHPRYPIRARRWQGRRGDRRRRARPNLRSVLLGSQEEGVAPNSGRAILGRIPSRDAIPAAHRRRGPDRIRRGRPGPTAGRRLGLQRDQHGADAIARQKDALRDSHEIEQGRQRLPHAAVRGSRRQRVRQAALPEGSDVQGAQQRAARHREQPDGEYRQDETINVGFSVPPGIRPRQRQFHPERAQQGDDQCRSAGIAADAIDHGHVTASR